MGSFVESLKRLYKKGSLTKSHINSLKEKGRITHEEMEYILSAAVESEYETAYKIVTGEGTESIY